MIMELFLYSTSLYADSCFPLIYFYCMNCHQKHHITYSGAQALITFAEYFCFFLNKFLLDCFNEMYLTTHFQRRQSYNQALGTKLMCLFMKT
jgi:hypothetical protein